MLSALAGVLFALVPLQQAEPAVELQAAIQKLTQADSLQFKMRETGSDSSRGGAGGSTGFGGYAQVAGTWKRGQPLQLTIEDVVAFKQGDALVYKDKTTPWKRLEGNPLDFGARPGGGAGGQTGGAAASGEPPVVTRKDAKGTTVSSFSSGPLDPVISVARMSSIDAPAESLAAFAATSVRKESKDGFEIYTGDLTPGAAAALVARKEQPPKEGDSAPTLQSIGAYSITVKDGAVVAAEFHVQQLGGLQIARSIQRTFGFKQGDVELSVPPEVLELLK